MALNDYEYSYRGLTFGGATNYGVVSESGILDVDTRVSDRPFPRKPGALSGKHLADAKTIEIVIEVRGTMASTTLATRIEDVMVAFTALNYDLPSEDSDQLVFKYPGFVEQYIRCRPIRRTLVQGRTFVSELGVRQIAVQLNAYDPRRYASDTTDSGVVTGSFNVTNAGNVYTYPRIVFTLNGSGNATLVNNTTGESLVIVGATASASLTANMGRAIRGDIVNKIIHEGSVDKYTKWQLPRTPWGLAPGVNSLTLSAGTNVEVFSHGAWS